ncbi:MAG: hypothetical protein ACK42E_02845, partial [Candidatus Bipolaricaulaceae bacterium]
LFVLGTVGFSATVGGDVLFELARPAQASVLSGADLAWPLASANPGALGFRTGWEFVSTYFSPFGAGHLGHLALLAPGLAAEALLFHAEVGPWLSYRAEGGALGLGLAAGALGLGGRARLLHLAQPAEGLGAALDLGFLWQGFFWLGGLAKNVWSKPAFPDEAWPLDFSGAIALPLRLFGLQLYVGAAAQDLLTLPRYACALALEAGVLSLATSLGSTGLALGGSLSWSSFRLEWAFLSHAHLPLSFRVSLAWRWP